MTLTEQTEQELVASWTFRGCPPFVCGGESVDTMTKFKRLAALPGYRPEIATALERFADAARVEDERKARLDAADQRKAGGHFDPALRAAHLREAAAEAADYEARRGERCEALLVEIRDALTAKK